MNCPVCRSPLRPGRFRNHTETWHLQAIGTFGLPLVFASGDAPPKILWTGGPRGADGHWCPDCGAVVLPGPAPEEEEWECPACGAIVPGRFDVCVRCQYRRR